MVVGGAAAGCCRLGNNQMLAADPRTGEVRRFLTGPMGCEIPGVQLTLEMRTIIGGIIGA